MNNMSIDSEILEEFREGLKDRYSPIELCELFIEHFHLSEEDILSIFGDEMIIDLHWR